MIGLRFFLFLGIAFSPMLAGCTTANSGLTGKDLAAVSGLRAGTHEEMIADGQTVQPGIRPSGRVFEVLFPSNDATGPGNTEWTFVRALHISADANGTVPEKSRIAPDIVSAINACGIVRTYTSMSEVTVEDAAQMGMVSIGSSRFVQFPLIVMNWDTVRPAESTNRDSYRIENVKGEIFGSVTDVAPGGRLHLDLSLAAHPTSASSEEAFRATVGNIDVSKTAASCNGKIVKSDGHAFTFLGSHWLSTDEGTFNLAVNLVEKPNP